jgi:drug/metabolite transporter (DMT)-like permease
LGAYLAMIFWVAGVKYTSASVASVLNQMSTVFIIFFAVLILKEKLSKRKVVGCLLGIAGALMVAV